MSTDVTASLSDSVCQRAQTWAQQAGRSLPDFLAEAVETSLLSLGHSPPPVHDWTDEEVLQAADQFMLPEDDRRLSELLALQREDSLDDRERLDLTRLMQVYQESLVRKSVALREAVRRGLREPLSP